jgi:flagellar motor component MotA
MTRLRSPDSETSAQRRTLFAAALLSAVLGSIHAFSILITPIEEKLDVDRARVSAVYSLGLVTLTASVLIYGSLR